MKIIAIDDEKLALESLTEAIRQAQPDADIQAFRNSNDLLTYIQDHPVHIAFLDVKIRDTDGLFLAKQLKGQYPDCNIIFVTAYSEYAVDAVSLRCSGYLLKPVTTEAVKREIESLRNPVQAESSRHIRVQTFGSFEVFYDNQPVSFKRAKSKEILAYLIDRKGAAVTTAEIAAVLFEDRTYNRSIQNQTQVYISDMLSALKAVRARDIIIRKYNSLSVNAEAIECDYYDFLRMKPVAVNSYRGEYMSNYSWAEFTTGMLQQQAEYHSFL